MFISPLGILYFFLFLGILVMIIAAAIWGARDAIRDARLRWRLRRHRSVDGWRPGRCLRCGYDIRANESRCSECGEPIMTLRPPPSKLL